MSEPRHISGPLADLINELRGRDAPRSPVPPEVAMYAARGWRMLLIEPHGKRPLAAACPHGVKDATADLEVIARRFGRWPDANLAIATGKPGPQVLDVDDPTKLPPAVAAVARTAPQVATARGGHAYFEGTDAGTISLEFGELRGTGSYVLAPPSIHPSGKEYVWLRMPHGPLPPVPKTIVRAGRKWGAGEMTDVETVAPGEMYDHLGDLATRLARAGIAHADVIERMLLAEFDAVRNPSSDYGDPERGRLDTRRIAEWAAGSLIAGRERDRAANGPASGLGAMWAGHGLRDGR